MGTWIVGSILVLIVAFVIFRMIQDKKNGKGCGGGCGCSCSQEQQKNCHK